MQDQNSKCPAAAAVRLEGGDGCTCIHLPDLLSNTTAMQQIQLIYGVGKHGCKCPLLATNSSFQRIAGGPT
jgi:hypothetical protein